MSEARPVARDAIRSDSVPAAAFRTEEWLGLAAAPAFAVMALLTILPRDGPPMLCSAGASALSGMAPMYLLMSAFHLPPWLRLVAGRRKASAGADPVQGGRAAQDCPPERALA